MADNTPVSLRNALIYCVYVRNYAKQGTFAEVQEDLERIRSLGADIIWFLPIHAIGGEKKKGSLGCPYSIRDYRSINPDYGTLEDFRQLCGAIHALGMRCMIDVVYNHTSWDSRLAAEHPEYFYRKPDGAFGNRAGEWDDIIDLDYNAGKDLWDYQIETLRFWARQGVDGFRCDVASLVPVDFWLRARQAVEEVRPGAIWLAESVSGGFIRKLREDGFACHSDGELYRAFDILYDYDIYHLYKGYFEGTNSLRDYLEAMSRQEIAYPQNYLKMRFLENHDQLRAAHYLPDRRKLEMWTAWMYFMRGAAQLYNGQECLDRHTPSLFDVDKVDWSGGDSGYTTLLQALARIKKDPLLAHGSYRLEACGEQGNVAVACYWDGTRKLVGVFDLELCGQPVSVGVPDGQYTNLLDKATAVTVSGGRVEPAGRPLIFECYSE